MDKFNLVFTIKNAITKKTIKMRGYETKHFFVDANGKKWRKD